MTYLREAIALDIIFGGEAKELLYEWKKSDDWRGPTI